MCESFLVCIQNIIIIIIIAIITTTIITITITEYKPNWDCCVPEGLSSEEGVPKTGSHGTALLAGGAAAMSPQCVCLCLKCDCVRLKNCVSFKVCLSVSIFEVSVRHYERVKVPDVA